jgi:T-complex protein 1 subunit zeta
LGFAELVYEHTLGEDAFTFVEGCQNATSCSILIRGPNDFTIRQIKDAVRDGLRAVVNVIEDNSVVPGAGAFEVAAHLHLLKTKNLVQGRAKLGYQAFADSLLVIPKTLAANSGLDVQTSLIGLLEAGAKGQTVGLDISTGKPLLPAQAGIWDNHRVKRQFLHLGTLIAVKLLLVDEVMRAGRKMGKG